MVAGVPHQPIFCANCGADGGWVPEDAVHHAFYLCKPCHDRLPPIDGTYSVPDEVFWAKWREAQTEKYGRLLSETETLHQLSDPDSFATKFARDRTALTPK